MQEIINRLITAAVAACLLLPCSGCGGGGAGGGAAAVETTNVSGVAVKGPIRGALVQIFGLRANGTTSELLGSATTASDGSYSVEIPSAKAQAPLLVKVSGASGASYASETTGGQVEFGAAEAFHAALDRYQPGRRYAVGPLTEAAYQQLQKFVTDNPSLSADARIIGAANARVASLFGVADVLSDPAADPAYSNALKIIDQMVQDAKASGAADTRQTMALINQAFVDVARPAYQSYRTALVAAATKVKGREPLLAAGVDAMLANAAAPPAEPDWSDTSAPAAVTGLKARAGAETASTSSVALSWSAAARTGGNEVAGYEIYRDGARIAAVSALAYTDAPLLPSTGYSYRVVAFDAAGNRSASSAEVSVTTPAAPNLAITVGGELTSDVTALPFKDITAPSVPTNLAASASAIDAVTSSVRLTWSAASDAVAVTGYRIYRDGVRIGTATGTSYTDPSVPSGVSYSYTILALDAAGNRSGASAALSVTPVAPNLGINVRGGLSPALTGL